MQIKRLILKNFRNFKEEEFLFSRVNIITGLNGKGKSNLLEAVYFLGNGYSPRLVKTDNIVKWGENFFYIKGEIERDDGFYEVEISYQNIKTIKINGKKIKKKIELISKFPMVIFFPQLVDFLFSSPSKRRYFLDREISKTSLYYYFNLIKYLGLLKRRNVILKKTEGGFSDFLDTLDNELFKIGVYIIKERLKFIENLNRCINIFNEIFGFYNLKIEYVSSIKDTDKFKDILFKERDRDIKRGYTQKGPHRDDIRFILKGHDARLFASQGEKKLIVLFLIFSLWRMMTEKSILPVLLIDEFGAELDREKVKILSGIIERAKNQIFITSLEDIEYIKEKKEIRL